MIDKKFIPISEPSIGEEEMDNVIEAMNSGWISSKGPYIQEFESGFSRFLGVKHGVSTSNGTTALHLALTALGVGSGDNVIVPDLTFISPVNAILYNGATPRLVDSNRSYWNLDPNKIEELIDERTKAIVVVHLYGHPAEMETIMKIAKDHDLYVIEDCAEAHGAKYNDKIVGSFGDISCFSFYGNKIITTGEGGMCLTNSDELKDKLETLRDHGMKQERRYWHGMVGYNYRMTNLQAAIGVAQLKKIFKIIEKKRKIASLYNNQLKDIEGILVQPEMSWAKSVFWLYSVLVMGNQNGISRDVLSKKLLDRSIDNRRFFYPAHVMPPYKNFGNNREFPVADILSQTGINLPSSSILEEDEITYITEAILSIVHQRS